MTTTVLSPSGQGGYLLPAGYLSTNGSQIVDSKGNSVRIDAIGWNGSAGAAGGEPEGLNITSFQTIMDALKADGFNTIRMPWSDIGLTAMPATGTINYALNPSLQGLNTLQIFQQIVAYAGQIGLKIIFDHHTDDGGPSGEGGQQANGLWFDSGPGSNGTDGSQTTGTVTAAKFEQDTVSLAKTFAGNSSVIGFDLDNEPFAGNINWGQGGATDIQAMYTTVGNAVEAVDPGALIICEGPQEYNPPPAGSGMSSTVAAPEGDLTGVATDPVTLTTPNKVVYSVHEYPSTISGTSSDSGASYIQELNGAWGYLETNNIAPVWIGEMGASLDGTADSAGAGLANEQAWASALLGYMNGKDGAQGGPTFTGDQQPISGSWWLVGDDAGQYPDGIQTAWGLGNYNPAQQAVTNQMLFIPTTPVSSTSGSEVFPSANDAVVLLGSTAGITDANDNRWTVTSGGQVAINGIADTLTANVTELAYVGGTIWQENTSRLWWGETAPNDAWAPQLGTAVSPLPAVAPMPSVNDTVLLAGSTVGIMDAAGNAWTITSGGQVAINGMSDTLTANVIELAYVGGTIWQENTSRLWWGETAPNDAWAPQLGTAVSPLPAVAPVPSVNDTMILAGSTVGIMDAAGNAWTITSSGQVAINGMSDTLTANVIELAYVGGTVWQENTSRLWWGETAPNDAWAPQLGTAVSPLPATGTITAYGGSSGTANLGSAASLFYLGGPGETVIGGSGNDTFYVNAATVGATIMGGSSTNALDVQGGGSIAMGSNITAIQGVVLDNAASYNFVANSIAGLAIHAGAGSDTVTVGAPSQTVYGSTGVLTIQATAANAGVSIHAGSGRVTLAITTSGSVSILNSDSNITLQLAASDTLILPANTSIAIDGNVAGGDDLLVTDGVLRAGQNFTGGGGANALLLQGSGLFDLSAPTTLSGIEVADAADATATQSRLITLRAGLDLTLNVLDGAKTIVRGSADNDRINLGSGYSVVTLGGTGESVNGGTGADFYYVTTATIGATITGGSGSNTLQVEGGGTVVMGASITGVPTVFLNAAASSYDFVANTTAGLAIHASSTNDTIVVGAASQVVFGSSGSLTVDATAAAAAVLIHTGSGGATLHLTTGGNAALNASDTNLTVTLGASTNLGLGAMSFITAIGATVGGDKITAGGAKQVLESIGGNDTLVGSAAFGDTFLGTATGLAGDTIRAFGGSDVIDITDLVPGTLKALAYNSSTNALTIADGTHGVTLTMSGGFSLASFATASDGHGGVLVKLV